MNEKYEGYERRYDGERVVSVGKWMAMDLVLAIPFVGFIYYLVLLLGSGNRNQVNFIRAKFIWSIIATVLFVVIIVLICLSFIKLPDWVHGNYESLDELFSAIKNS